MAQRDTGWKSPRLMLRPAAARCLELLSDWLPRLAHLHGRGDPFPGAPLSGLSTTAPSGGLPQLPRGECVVLLPHVVSSLAVSHSHCQQSSKPPHLPVCCGSPMSSLSLQPKERQIVFVVICVSLYISHPTSNPPSDTEPAGCPYCHRFPRRTLTLGELSGVLPASTVNSPGPEPGGAYPSPRPPAGVIKRGARRVQGFDVNTNRRLIRPLPRSVPVPAASGAVSLCQQRGPPLPHAHLPPFSRQRGPAKG